nr:hemin uptake protein HemP [Pseudorhodoferax soli]
MSPLSAADALSVDSYELLRGQKAVEIKHNGAIYRLQTTKLGKLILTK